MEKINEDFNIPYYIFEEIIEYSKLVGTNKQEKKLSTIKSLLRLAIINKRLSEEQVIFLQDNFCKQ